MPTKWWIAWLLVAAGAVLTECGVPVGGNSTPSPGARGASSGTPMPISPQAQPAVDAALQAASSRLGLPRDQLRVVQVDEREWRDSSLGCPQPGQLYAQVITPGYLVAIEGGGRRVEVHTDTRGRAVICP